MRGLRDPYRRVGAVEGGRVGDAAPKGALVHLAAGGAAISGGRGRAARALGRRLVLGAFRQALEVGGRHALQGKRRAVDCRVDQTDRRLHPTQPPSAPAAAPSHDHIAAAFENQPLAVETAASCPSLPPLHADGAPISAYAATAHPAHPPHPHPPAAPPECTRSCRSSQTRAA